jgi:protein-S-isoprenylcysteine O-methyltransferase Ste14
MSSPLVTPASDAPATEAAPSPTTPTSEVKPKPARAPAAVRLPPSASHFGLNCITLGIVLATLYWLRTHHRTLQDDILVLCGAVALPTIAIDVFILKTHKRDSTGLDWDRPFEIHFGRVITKMIGLAFTVGLIAFAYWVFPEYHGSFYDPLYNLLRRMAPTLVGSAIVYIGLVDGLMKEPHDAYWQLGRIVLGRWRDANGATIANHFLGWLVKAFFLPLMLVWLHGNVRGLVTLDLHDASINNLRLYDYLNTLIFGVDLLFATVGYILSLRVVDTHIRTAEPTFLGWSVALVCYEPFYSGIAPHYLKYDEGYGFGAWLEPYPVFRWVWAGAILFLIAVYMLATVNFGIRFSNLTHRGILTDGPYRFTKHPAYVCKNTSWWLVSIPFVTHFGWENTIRHSVMLAMFNFIYFMRARTEERHLSKDPVYVEYALWMNEHGALAFLGRWIPLLKYKPPKDYVPPSA